MKSAEEIFFLVKPVKILLSLKKGNKRKYASILAREADCTYSHTVSVLDKFEELGLVKFHKEGRKKFIELTEKGEEISEELGQVWDDLSQLD